MNSVIVRFERGSRFEVGSSSTSTAGRIDSTDAIAARFFCPKERCSPGLPATSASPTAASAVSTRSQTSSSGRPMLRGPNATSSRMLVMNSMLSGSWKTTPTRWRTPLTVSGVTATFSIATTPSCACVMPFRWPISVDLPAPLGPSSATRSPWATVRLMPSSAFVPSGYRYVRSRSSIAVASQCTGQVQSLAVHAYGYGKQGG